MSKQTLDIEAQRPDLPVSMPVVPLRHPERWVLAGIVAVFAALVIKILITNENFEWDTVAGWLTAKTIIEGLWLTLGLTAIAMVGGVVLGVTLALMRQSGNLIIAGVATAYVWFFRGTPLLVQLIFWYNLAALTPTLSIGVPFGPQVATWDTNEVITPFVAAIVGLALNEGAYMAEIVRGGLLSVPPGQVEAADAVGLSRWRTHRRIVLPQALRIIIPPTGNQTISMLKATSLVSVISMSELLYSAQTVYNRNYDTIPLLVVVSIWYLLITTILSIGQYFLEREYGKSTRRVQDSRMASVLERVRKHRSGRTPASRSTHPSATDGGGDDGRRA